MKIPKKKTDSEVYHLGIDALINNFGTAGASRFLNQIEPRTGNHTLERHEWLNKIDRKIGLELIKEIRKANAESGNADVFLTTDDRLLRRAKRLSSKLHVQVENPYEWLQSEDN